jgi:hypothetical protein
MQLYPPVHTISRNIVVTLRPNLLDLLGFPEWLPRRQPRAYRLLAIADELIE